MLDGTDRMPSATTYSPYETLTFFQSAAKYGVDASALQDISAALKKDEHIRNNTSFDEKRLSVQALQGLYHHHISPRQDRQNRAVNGDSSSGERSPKRRKVSTPEQSHGDFPLEEEAALLDLVDQLYVRYRNEIVREIRADEQSFIQLQDDIRILELQVEKDKKQNVSQDISAHPLTQSEGKAVVTSRENDQSFSQPSSVPQDVNKTSELSHTSLLSTSENGATSTHRQQANSPHTIDVPVPPQSQILQQRPAARPVSPAINQHHSPIATQRQLPSNPSQRPSYGSIQPQPAFLQTLTPSGHTPPVAGSGQLRTQPRAHQSSTQGRASPMPYPSPHNYQQYPQYPHAQWHPPPTPQQYQQHNPYVHPQYYPQPPNGRPLHIPQPIPYTPYPHSTPQPYMQPQPQWRGQPWPQHPASAFTTPVARHDGRSSMPGSRSSTPWKKRQQQSQLRSKTPPLPDREVSPLTDQEETSITTKESSRLDTKLQRNEQHVTKFQRQRRHQPASVTPSAVSPSRSQSVASQASDVAAERQKSGQKIKAEPPSTPLPAGFSDNEQRSSGRNGRPRSSTVKSQADGSRAPTTKRKRSSVSPTSPNNSSQSLFVTPLTTRQSRPLHPSLVVLSKNFSKTSQLLLNEITSHKLAGIFSKPLSERDAPGYKDVILRSQDLKSVKAAISKGGRAALPSIDIVESERESSMTPRAQNTSSLAGEPGSIGNGFYLVPKSVDLMPPKGIVNSAQLEMELVRMFANAVMFNPLPTSERGFGRSLRLKKHGESFESDIEVEDTTSLEDSENGSSSGAEEDGIIADAREMFNDVVETVGKWRELEDERMASGTENSVSRHGSLAVQHLSTTEVGRHASVGASSNLGDDGIAAGESETASTPVPSTMSGPGRKRRRVGER